MSSGVLGPFGPLSNREIEFQYQNILVIDEDGRLRFAPPFVRRSPTVPPEILAEIFTQCLPDDDFTTPSLTTAPLVLCGICRQWRGLALSTPRLWSSLFLDFDVMLPKDGMVELYQMWLSRARGAPLSLCLEDLEEQQVPKGPIRLLLKQIVGLSQQWRNVEFDIGRDLAHFIFPIEGAFPLLEKFNLSVMSLGELPIFFYDTPNLRDVSVLRYSSQIRVPWHQLTTFCCQDIEIGSCLDILCHTSNLLDGTFYLRKGPPLPLISVLEHVHLHHLVLSAIDEDLPTTNPMPVLDFLKTPALKSLTLEFTNYDGTQAIDFSPFLSFLSRSSARLHTLALSYMPTTSDTLIECLKATSSLVVLKLTPVPPLFDLDAIFAHCTGLSDFLPVLESFHAAAPVSEDDPRITASVVIQMLCYRRAAAGISRLQSFRLSHYGSRPQFDEAMTSHPEFQRLKAQGMDLHVGTYV
ncbi:hypothetical protein B0H19DRAFT_1190686 [Mycena capillaripes]|nr:hypothetical protein B0H19DRAFT_1190686 [Mycena capillaripes]